MRPASSVFRTQRRWTTSGKAAAGSSTSFRRWRRRPRMPKVVAVIGASSDRRKFGNRALRAFRAQGYTVIPINPNEREVEGMKTYPSVLDVPGSIDTATFYVPPDAGGRVIGDGAKQGVGEVRFNPVAESVALIE